MPIKVGTPVEIEWIDTIRSEIGWEAYEAIEFEETRRQMLHRSLGYVLEDHPTAITISQSRKLVVLDPDDGPMSDTRLTIPREAIRAIRKVVV